jgi:hypothetical protein
MRLALLASLLVSWAVLAQRADAQSGPLVVPPGYEAVRPAAAPAAAPVFVTAPPRMPAGHWETRTEERAVRGLWLTGLITLPVSWILTWTVASTGLPTASAGIAYSYIPLVGPWLMLTEPLNGYDGFAVVMGIAQAAGALMLVLGLTLRETVERQVWVTADLGSGRTLALDAGAGPEGAFGTLTLSF